MSSNAENLSRSICEVCGKDFSCGAQIGKCWCFEIEMTEKSLEEIRQNHEKCLCRDCLRAYNEKNLSA